MRSFKLYPEGILFKSAGVEVRAIGLRERMPACVIDRPEGRRDYLIMYFHSAARVGTGPGAPMWPGGQMMVWPAGMAQFYGNMTSGFMHTWVHCSGRRVEEAVKRSGVPVGRVFEMPDGGAADRHVELIYDELVHQKRPEPVVVGNLVENMLVDVARIRRGEGAGRVPEPVIRCKQMIEAEYERALSLKGLAGHAGLSVSHLCALFKAHEGVGVIGYLIQVRVSRAAMLLKRTGLKVEEVARMVGYGDVYHFSKLFKKEMGVPPGAFRGSGRGGQK